jgi:hypothetical protein
MFDFNTVDVAWLDAQMARVPDALTCIRPQVHHVHWLRGRRAVEADAGGVGTIPAARDRS